MSINMSLIYCISGLVSQNSYTKCASHFHRNKCILQRFLTSTVFFGDSEGIRFNNEISMYCYVRYMPKYALKIAVKH